METILNPEGNLNMIIKDHPLFTSIVLFLLVYAFYIKFFYKIRTKEEIEKENENYLAEEVKENKEFLKKLANEDSSGSASQGFVEFLRSPFGKFANIIFLATMALFVISMMFRLVWYVPAMASISFPVLFLIHGFREENNNLIMFSVLFLVVAFLVGGGTCLQNISGI